MKDKIVLVGFGGHAESVIDSIEASGKYEIVGYTDTNNKINCRGYTYLGNDENLESIYLEGIHNAFITIGYMGKNDLRDKLYYMLKKTGFNMPVITDPSAIISSSAEIGEGTFIGKGCVLNTGSKIGRMCIINSCALIEHGSVVNDFTHIAVRSALCGNVTIGSHCFIGAASIVIQGITVGENVITGAGAVVTSSLPDGCTAVGIPAKPVKDRSL
ncbi:MAG: acetyltransferase [Lachnospiraceae bacterium]|nr:acetyltransferase [Lachnospiraceae bacterium]